MLASQGMLLCGAMYLMPVLNKCGVDAAVSLRSTTRAKLSACCCSSCCAVRPVWSYCTATVAVVLPFRCWKLQGMLLLLSGAVYIIMLVFKQGCQNAGVSLAQWVAWDIAC